MYSFVAMLNCVTALPLDRLRISGSRVRRPVNRTLFTVRVLLLGRPTGHRGRPCVSGGIDAAGCGGSGPRPAGRGDEAGAGGGLPPRSGSADLLVCESVGTAVGGAGWSLAGTTDASRRRFAGDHPALIGGSPGRK